MTPHDQRLQRLRVAAFVLATLGLLVATILILGHSESLFASKAMLHTSFVNAGGLFSGAPVRLAGVDIGIVKDVSFDKQVGSKHVDVELSIGRQYLDRIRSDSYARINSKGLLGDMIVDITLGSADQPALHDGDELASVESAGLAQIVDSVQEAIRGVDGLVKDVDTRLREIITPQATEDFGRFTHAAAGIMEGVERGSGLAHALIYDPALANQAGAVFQDFRGIASHADASLSEARRLITDARTGNGLLHTLVYDQRGDQLLTELQSLLADLSILLTQVNNGHGLVHSLLYEEDRTNLVENLGEASRILRQLAEETDQGKGTVGGLLKDPTAYEDLTTVVENLKRNELLKALIRLTVVKDGLSRPPGRVEATPAP